MIGTRGVPARYGGFETAVEEIGRRLADAGHEVTVYCRGERHPDRMYLGMRLVHLPAVKKKVAETLSHTALSVTHSAARRITRRGPDAALVFNAANAPLLPVLRAMRIPVATHVDGLEWKRTKWSGSGRRYYLAVERLAVRWSDALIADAVGIRDYYQEKFGAESVFIPYGAPILEGADAGKLAEAGYAPGGFHLVVARFEPENHVHLAVEGYRRSAARKPLVVVGSAPYADEYTTRVRELAGDDPRITFLGGVWDQDLLDSLYAGALTYVHGHSVGGTNPSLLRAMGAGASVLAYDVNFNREVLGEDAGRFFGDPAALAQELEAAEADPGHAADRGEEARKRAAERYVWDDIARDYERLCEDLAERRLTRRTVRPKR
ncbi:glycosyltransferase family 1 protein [Actinomadura harenae]|uniref:Glycosyltransferase family 1 protein n=2 Tax=Actinomadura harenae TaxID=2483351 RepID=A0A3M2LW19_9ACTN|nr:glycosyltransferase family 1 protein [Actinomadura harenae]